MDRSYPLPRCVNTKVAGCFHDNTPSNKKVSVCPTKGTEMTAIQSGRMFTGSEDVSEDVPGPAGNDLEPGLPMIELIPIDAELAQTLADGAAGFEARHRVVLGNVHGSLHDIVRQTLDHERRVPRPPPWVGQIAVDHARRVVGAGGFSNNPAADGMAEIAYHTFPAFERRGHGTAIAIALVRLVRDAGSVPWVIAHTLPVDGASPRILARVGFRNEGEITHPEDGRVWRWSLRVDGL